MAGAPEASRESIGFIGLGALGAPMAINLIHAGFPLTLHNRSREREAVLLAELAAGQNAGNNDNHSAPTRRAGSPAEAAAAAGDGTGILCLCLSDDAAVEAVLLEGDGAAIHGLKPGSLVVDFSTIAPATTRRLAERCAASGVAWLDAPVTGGTEGARAGTLSVLVGGDAHDLERARALLEVVGGRITHLGPVGSGQQAKAVNQVLVAGSYAAVAEAMALGQRLGLPMPELVQALQGGAAGSWALTHRAANMLNGHYPLGFKLSLHRKDLAIALAEAAAAGLELPVSERVAALQAGADDALGSPYALEELHARLLSLLRRARMGANDSAGSLLSYGDLLVDTDQRQVKRAGMAIRLTVKEYDLLLFLLRHQQQVLPRQRILHGVWGDTWVGDDNLLDVYIRYLRKKIERADLEPLIHTVRGVGFVLK